MPTYSYTCSVCGTFDRLRPMAEAAAEANCPDCERVSRRVWSAPSLRAMDPSLRGALDASVRSSDAPRVVTSVPQRTGTDRARVMKRASDPRQARLPRP